MIRQVTKEDLEECLHVIRAGFGTVAEEFHLTKENCPTNGAFMTMERLSADFASGKPMVAAVLDGKIVGFAELEDKGVKESDRVFEFQKIAVVPEYRHCGVGKNLLNTVKGKAREMGAEVLSIGIIEENTVLRNWYLENGFEHLGTRVFEHLPFTVGFMQMKL